MTYKNPPVFLNEMKYGMQIYKSEKNLKMGIHVKKLTGTS